MSDINDELVKKYQKAAKALNVLAAKLNLAGMEIPKVEKFIPFKGTPEQRQKIVDALKGKTVNNTGWTTILGYCGITGTAPVLNARHALEAAEVIEVEEVEGVGRNTGKKICLYGETMKPLVDVIK